MFDINALAADARSSIWLTRVCRLVEYVGDGLPLTSTGNLKLSDGKALVPILQTRDRVDEAIGDRVFKTRSVKNLPEVDLTFRIALAIGALTVDGGRVTRGWNDLSVGPTLEAWDHVFVALADKVGVVQHRYGDDTYGWAWFAADLDDMRPSLLINLHDTTLRVPMERLLNGVWDELMDCYDFSDVPKDKLDFHRGLVGRSLHYALQTLAEHGAVDMDDAALLHLSGADAEGTVTLTALGRWAVGVQLSRAAR